MSTNPIWVAGYGTTPVAGASPVWIAGYGKAVAGAAEAWIAGWGGSPVPGATPVQIMGYGGPVAGASPIWIGGTLSSAGGGAVTGSTWSASDAATNSMTLSNGGLTVTPTHDGNQSIRGTTSHSTGKWYAEIKAATLPGGVK